MFKYLSQIWKTKDLRRKILFTIFILIVFRIAAHIPVPGINMEVLKGLISGDTGTGGLDLLAMLTGGSIRRFSIVLMGISPYINASIIVQLLTVIVPKLEALSKEGESGRNIINKYTRLLTFPLAFVQSLGMIFVINRATNFQLINMSDPWQILPIMLFVSVGTLFLVWLGELITQKGIGNGISLIIFAGIVSNMPIVLARLLGVSLETGMSGQLMAFILFVIVSLLLLFVIIMFTEGHRNIPITYAGRGRNEKAGLPIRINQAGMIPIIFAISMVSFPMILGQLLTTAKSPWLQSIRMFIVRYLDKSNPSFLYMLIYFLLVIAFSYFYVSITFNPEQVAENIQKRGGFIPGIRPGRQTATFLAKVSNHLNLFGGCFLGIVAIMPILFTKFSQLNSSDLIISGSGLIIVVGVVLELIRQINAQLVMHDYDKLV